MNKAYRIHRFGGPEVLQLEELPIPVAGEGDVVVAVKAAGVNLLDWKFREGWVSNLPFPLPLVLGVEFMGSVHEVGPGVTGFKPGDRVMGFQHAFGGYAQYRSIKADQIARVPDALPDIAAGALPIPLTTAWQAIYANGTPPVGSTILVHGAAGAVGSIAVQLAKAAGARVVATASTANVDYVRSLGADDVIDYTAERFEDRVQDVDLVLDLVGEDTLDRSWSVLAPGGAIASILHYDVAARAPEGKRGIWVQAQPEPALLERLAQDVADGRIRSKINAVYPASDLKTAIESTRVQRLPGKTMADFTRW